MKMVGLDPFRDDPIASDSECENDDIGEAKKIIAVEECMDACIGNQSDVVVVNKGEHSHKVVDPIEQRVDLHLGFALLLGQLIEYDIK